MYPKLRDHPFNGNTTFKKLCLLSYKNNSNLIFLNIMVCVMYLTFFHPVTVQVLPSKDFMNTSPT